VDGVRRERWFLRMQRRANRCLEPIAKIPRRPVIEAPILEREQYPRPEIHLPGSVH
jgi:hypothetical protein